jgi:mannan endo-1,4-beta-mannosidase
MPALPQAWVGVNVWGLAATESVYSCGSAGGNHEQFLDTTFSELRSAGVDVVRFWAFEAYAMAKANGSRDWSALDRVFDNALQHGVYLMPALDNYWKDCNSWPITLYPNGQRHQGYPVSQVQWVDEIVSRYAGHPALLVWEVVNEPEANSHSTSDVQAFQAEMAGLVSAVKAADPDTPVSLGNLGSGQHGFSNTAYKQTFLASGADWMTAHDYQDWNVPIPWANSCSWNSMCSDLNDAQSLDVPFYIGETGSDGCDNSSKANALRAKIDAYHAQGAVGVVYWAFDIRAGAGNCGYDIGPDGTTIGVFGEY